MSGYEVIANGGRRRFWSAAEKLRIEPHRDCRRPVFL